MTTDYDTLPPIRSATEHVIELGKYQAVMQVSESYLRGAGDMALHEAKKQLVSKILWEVEKNIVFSVKPDIDSFTTTILAQVRMPRQDATEIAKLTEKKIRREHVVL